MRQISLYTLILILLSLGSCDPNMVYDQFEKTHNQKWSWEDTKVFEIDIEDSLSYFNMYANIRHTKEYPKSNLYLFITIKSPLGDEIRDTVDIQIADKHGRWNGSGFGEIKFVRKKIKHGVRFANKGKYIVEVEQGMRIAEIPVTDVGIRVEKFNQ